MKHNILKNLIYVFQLEHYDRKRFLKFSYRNFWKLFDLSKRGDIVWTLRAKEEYFLSLFFILVSLYFSFKFSQYYLILFIILFLPFFVILADLFIKPYIEYKKKQRRKLAQKILERSKIKIIGITGSYGKTGTKNILETILAEKFRILKPAGNINTDMGVSNFIIEKQGKLDDYDFLIVEMGAYRIGDIKLLTEITQPEYSLTVSIGQNHLDRFGSQENIIKAKFELAENTKNKSFLNGCDENIKNNLEKFLNGKKYQAKCVFDEIKNFHYLDDFKGISFEYKNQIFETKLLARHNLINIFLGIQLAEELGLSLNEIKEGVKQIEHTEHRLFPMKNEKTEVMVIDDSYNGNYAGFLSGLEVLRNAKGRKVVLTPGIVELTEKKSFRVHQDLAKKYMEMVDLVLLVKNSNTKIILDYFQKNNFEKYKLYQKATEAHNDLKNILKSGDTIIFQNDLPDNYD